MITWDKTMRAVNRLSWVGLTVRTDASKNNYQVGTRGWNYADGEIRAEDDTGPP